MKIKTHITKRKKIFSFFLPVFAIAGFVLFFAYGAGAVYTYTPMENIPGFEGTADFPSYLLAITKFALWTVGIAALFMISWGGFMYMTSAGNTSRAESAKRIIGDALFGLLIALAAWLLLFVINPELVSVNLTLKPVSTALTTKIEEYEAKRYTGKYPAIPASMPKNCKDPKWQEIFTKVAAQKGIDKCILQATAAKESGCSQVPARTYNGQDCSVMQVRALEHCGTTCEDLEKNPEKAVSCAADVLNSCSAKWRRNPTDQWIRDYYAGYNGGCGALNASSSCAGQVNQYGNPYRKYDCPKDCGGYCPVPARTSTFLTYYNQCKAGN